MCRHREDDHQPTKETGLRRKQIHLDLKLPSLQNCVKIPDLFKLPSLWYFVMRRLKLTDIPHNVHGVLEPRRAPPNRKESLFLPNLTQPCPCFHFYSPATSWIAPSPLGATLGYMHIQGEVRIPLLLTYMLLNCHLYKGESISLLRFI